MVKFNFLGNQIKISIKRLVVLSVVILSGILFFGLKPDGYNFSNNVNWITDRPGIHFSKYGIAYTKPFIDYNREDISGSNGFSVEIALKPADYRKAGFNVIFAIHSGKESNNLLLVQVHSRIYLVSGDDYDIKRGTKSIKANLTFPSSKTQFVTITTGKLGSAIYLNGQLVRTKNDLTLRIPSHSKARLLLGNSVYGKHSWQGNIYGLALYGYTLTAQNIKLHFDRWFQNKNFSFAKRDNPLALYFFDEQGGVRAIDHASGSHPLNIPSRMKIFKKEMLSLTWSELKLSRIINEDNIINLLGFFPLGFVLAAILMKLGGNFYKYYILITVSFCFIVSLTIEIVQAWLPSRSSSITDLIFNTIGSLIGALILRLFTMRIYNKRTP